MNPMTAFRTMLLMTLAAAFMGALPAWAQKATPEIATPPTASGITHGYVLSFSTLSGGEARVDGAKVDGTFAWTTPGKAPDVGVSAQPVTFTPNDLENYTTAAGTANVTATMRHLTYVCDGGAKGATATTIPAGLLVEITYDGGSAAPSSPGVYTIRAMVNDTNYEGFAMVILTITDTTAPVLELRGPETATVLRGHAYKDAGATAFDACTGDLTARIVTANSVNTAVVGTYTVTYDVGDGNGNNALQVKRTVNVIASDVTPPVISSRIPDRSLAADASCAARVPDLTGEVSATDDVTPIQDLKITQNPAAGTEIKGLGAHTVTLSVKDEAGNEATCGAILDVTVFDHSASVPTAVAWATNGPVNAMAATDDALYIGGEFTWAGNDGGSGDGWSNLAKIDLATGEVLEWRPVAGGVVHALALSTDGATLYAGGDGFVDEVDVSTAASARVTAATGMVVALAVSDGVLFLGGEFTQAAGPNCHLEAYDLTANAFLDWTANLAGPALSLAVSDTTLYVGEADGIETVDIAANGKGGVALFTASNGPVNTLAATCGTVYAGGGFAGIGGQTCSGIAALDLSGAAKSAWAPSADSAVRALVLTGAALYAAGEFTTIDSLTLPGLVQFNDGSDPAAMLPVNLGALSREEVKGLAKEYVTFGSGACASPLSMPFSDRICCGSEFA